MRGARPSSDRRRAGEIGLSQSDHRAVQIEEVIPNGCQEEGCEEEGHEEEGCEEEEVTSFLDLARPEGCADHRQPPLIAFSTHAAC
jgi:hypothetical protein